VTAMTLSQLCDVFRSAATIQIALLRHAQADVHGQFCGHSDPGLSQRGHEQIPVLIQSLSRLMPCAVWSSDRQRAIQTAEPIAKFFGLDYGISAALREMNFGMWEGLTWNEIELQFPEDASAWARGFPNHRPPGGESFVELQSRVVEELAQLAKHAQPGCTLVVTHAGFIRTAVAWVLGMPNQRLVRIGQDYGALTILENVRNHWAVTALNVAPRSCDESGRKNR